MVDFSLTCSFGLLAMDKQDLGASELQWAWGLHIGLESGDDFAKDVYETEK